MEKSSIELLTDFAKKNNYSFLSNTQPNTSIISSMSSLVNKKFFVLEYTVGVHTYNYVAFDAGANYTFSGIFRNYSNREIPELKVRPKFWIDFLTFRHKAQSGISELDKKLYINCSKDSFVKQVVNQKVGLEFLKLYDKVSPIELVVEENCMYYNPKLTAKSIIGLKTNRWITEEAELNLFLEQGSKLLNMIKKD